MRLEPYTTHMEPLLTAVTSNHVVKCFRHVTLTVQANFLIQRIILTVAFGKRTVGKWCKVSVFKALGQVLPHLVLME